MARDIKQSARGSNGGQDIIIKFSTKRHWGTKLEQRLSQLPFPELGWAFKTAAEVWEGRGSELSVDYIVQETERFAISNAPVTSEFFYDHAASVLDKDIRRRAKRPEDLPFLSHCSVCAVFANLWRVTHRFAQHSKELPPSQLVADITKVCLLAERARHTLYSEKRVDQWHQFVSEGILRSRKSSGQPTRRAKHVLLKEASDSIFTWYETHRGKFTNIEDAITALVESELLPFDPMFLHAFFRLLEAKTAS